MKNEADFFNSIAPRIIQLVESFEGKASVSVSKLHGDFATEVDIAVENLIVDEISKLFPNDEIMAEEGHSDTAIPAGRIWIIDPICGTTNIGRGMKNFCTNIALADHEVLIASCVVDHSQNDYFWSVGDSKVYINDKLSIRPIRPEGFGTAIDIDLGCLNFTEPKVVQKHIKAVHKLLIEDNFALVSLNTSLGFAYTAIGKLDGFISAYNHPWDICASMFLIQQSGGVTSDLAGNTWTIASNQAIAAINPVIHRKLLRTYC